MTAIQLWLRIPVLLRAVIVGLAAGLLGIVPWATLVVYGGLAYATNSTFPSMVLHTGGNVLSALSLFTQGRSEWQLGTPPAHLVWESGVDAAFIANVVAFLAVGLGTFLAYRALISAGREVRLHAA
jgi:4-amino-4-deoxy-L-arabinose transferase-like glycosyltransferase